MSRLNLWLLRHGESATNTGVWSAHPNDTPLTPHGIEQARKAAASIDAAPDVLIVSPLLRAQETADCISERWPLVSRVTWPIQEFVYLSPSRLAILDTDARRALVRSYWERADPDYTDGKDAESFVAFLMRVEAFYAALKPLTADFAVAVGHGLFFSAFLQGLSCGFHPTSEWMSHFRVQETAHPLSNGVIYRLNLSL